MTPDDSLPPWLTDALRGDPATVPPPGLADRLTRAVLADRRRRRFRRLFAGLAVAAGLVGVLVAVAMLPSANSEPAVVLTLPEPTPPEEIAVMPALREGLAEASEAVAALTRRAAEEALPWVEPPPMVVETDDWRTAFEPAARSLDEVRQGAAGGLEPVTSGARRALAMFLRDLPPMTETTDVQ